MPNSKLLIFAILSDHIQIYQSSKRLGQSCNKIQILQKAFFYLCLRSSVQLAPLQSSSISTVDSAQTNFHFFKSWHKCDIGRGIEFQFICVCMQCICMPELQQYTQTSLHHISPSHIILTPGFSSHVQAEHLTSMSSSRCYKMWRKRIVVPWWDGLNEPLAQHEQTDDSTLLQGLCY